MKRKPWKKNLYDNTEYDDNYTDSTFLKDLKKNLNVRYFKYLEVVSGVTLLSNQITLVTGFLIVFYVLHTAMMKPTNILLTSLFGVFVGYIWYRRASIRIISIIEDSRTLVTVLVLGYIFAPVLHTLTSTISTDTIYSLTFFVMLINVLFHDYGLSVAMVSRTIAVNASIVGSICLASRLPTSYHAFVLIVVDVIFFLLYPMFIAEQWNSLMLIPLSGITLLILYNLSKTVFMLYAFTISIVNLICPFIFVKLQKHKNNIHGPWDEAIIEEKNEDQFDDLY